MKAVPETEADANAVSMAIVGKPSGRFACFYFMPFMRFKATT